MSNDSPASVGTVRARLRDALLVGPQTARDLSQCVGIAEHEVPGHLEHVERSLKAHGERLVIEPPICLACGFVFAERHRFTRPSHCPECREHRISLPRFHIER